MQENLKEYKQAGEIAKKCKKLAHDLIRPGAKLLDIAEKTEELIKKEGGKPAFPVNISVDAVSAHYTPDADAKDAIGKDDLVKFDVGVHVDGFIADTAFTVSMSKDEVHLKLIEAAEKALEKAVSMARPGTKVGDIGAEVEKVIKGYGFTPIENLTGHSLEQYSLHAGVVVPNVGNNNPTELEDGQAIAIEPFSTNGSGTVVDGNEVHIYEFLQNKPTRMMEARKILRMSYEDFGGLPFAKRWLGVSGMKLNLALKELERSKALYAYPMLQEKKGGLVAQAEHTVIVGEKPIVTT
jgi:methionyl aminopeptidase